jgi:hypothetical protein
MKGQVINLNRERWLSLANLALDAAGSLAAEKVNAVGAAADKMVTATPPSTARYAMAQCLSFRWGCKAFAEADPSLRPGLALTLEGQAHSIRHLFEHHPAPREAAGLPVPVQPALELDEPPLWTKRADIGGA